MSSISELTRLALLDDLLNLALKHHNDGRVKGLLNVPISPTSALNNDGIEAIEIKSHKSTSLLDDVTNAVRHIDSSRTITSQSRANTTNTATTLAPSGSPTTTVVAVPTTASSSSLENRIIAMEQKLFDRKEDRRIMAMAEISFSDESDLDCEDQMAKEEGRGEDVFRELQLTGKNERRSYDENAYRNEEFFRTTSISPTALDNVGNFILNKQRVGHRQKLERAKEDIIVEASREWNATAAARVLRGSAVVSPPTAVAGGDSSASTTTATLLEGSYGEIPTTTTTTTAPPVIVSRRQKKINRQREVDERAMQDLMWDPSLAEITPTVPTAHATKNRNAMLTQGYEPPDQVVITLQTDTIMHKPQGIDEKSSALKHQGYYCKGCLRSLKKSANPLRGWDAAVFCFYTGYYFCEECHDRSQVSVIPARVVQDWDFTEDMVSSLAHTFLDIHRCQTPMLCISAVNPALYDKVWLLRMVRDLRVELTALNAVGMRCEEFRKKFYSYTDAVIMVGGGSGNGSGRDVGGSFGDENHIGPRASALDAYRSRANSTTSNVSGASSFSSRRMSVSSAFSGMHLGLGTRSGRQLGGGAISGAESGGGGGGGNVLFDTDNDAYIPIYKRYLVMDTECWTLEDLQDIHQADPDNLGPELVKQWEDHNRKEQQKQREKQERRLKKKAAASKRVGIEVGNSMSVCTNTADHHPLTAFAGLSPLIEELLSVRRWFLRHILKECVDQCLPSAVHACRACSQNRGKDLIMSILPSASRCYKHCTQCDSYYHASCWDRLRNEARVFGGGSVLPEEWSGGDSSRLNESYNDDGTAPGGGSGGVIVCPECRNDASRAAKIQSARSLW